MEEVAITVRQHGATCNGGLSGVASGAIVSAATNPYRMRSAQEKSPFDAMFERAFYLAEWTGLEPATPGVTGRYSNQLNYHSNLASWPASVFASANRSAFLTEKRRRCFGVP